MSFLRGPPAQGGNGSVNSERVEMAITELDTVTDFFNRMVASCHTKCMNQRYNEPDLTVGESVCIDRCVGKYNEVQKKIGEKLQSRGEANQAAATGGMGSLGS